MFGIFRRYRYCIRLFYIRFCIVIVYGLVLAASEAKQRENKTVSGLIFIACSYANIGLPWFDRFDPEIRAKPWKSVVYGSVRYTGRNMFVFNENKMLPGVFFYVIAIAGIRLPWFDWFDPENQGQTLEIRVKPYYSPWNVYNCFLRRLSPNFCRCIHSRHLSDHDQSFWPWKSGQTIEITYLNKQN